MIGSLGCNKLEVLRDVIVRSRLVESAKRKVYNDKGKSERVLCEGEKVLC